MSSNAPTTGDLRQLLHDLREPLGALVIRLSLLDHDGSSAETRQHVEVMFSNVERIVKAVAGITAAFELEVGKSTPLAILTADRRRIRRGQLSAEQREAEKSA